MANEIYGFKDNKEISEVILKSEAATNADLAVERARIDEIVTERNVDLSEVVLFEGTARYKDTSYQLNQSVSGFDVLDFYLEMTSRGYREIKTIPVIENRVYVLNIANLSDTGEYAVQIGEICVKVAENILTITSQTGISFAPSGDGISGVVTANAPELIKAVGGQIYKIVGRKTAENAEVADARIGVDGITHPTLGEYLREIHDELSDIRTGNDGTEYENAGDAVRAQTTVDDTLSQRGQAADAKAAGDAIDQIKEDLTDISETSNNIFDGNVVNLAFSSGKVVSGDSYVSFYWEVSNGETYTLSRRNTTDFNRFRVGFTRELPAVGVLVYKEDGTQFTPTSAGDSLTVQTVTVPDRYEFKYAMVYLSNSGQTIDDSCKLMINKGSTAQEWEKYFRTAVDAIARDKLADFDGNTGIVQRNGIAETTLKLQQLNRPTRTASRTLGTAPLCLLHFSDIHGDKKRLQNIIEFKEYYSDYIADIIHTGDMVEYHSTDGIAFWNEVDGAEDILNVIGNHDTLVGSTWIGMTMAEAYTTYFAPYISNWGVTGTSGQTYYYKDYTTNKVRLIFLDIMHQSADQLTWFTSTLASARTANLHVIVAVHSRPHWQFTSHQTAWDDKPLVPSYTEGYSDTSASTYPENLSDDYADAVDDFMTGGGYFVCWIHGHTHHKMFAQLQTHPNQLDVSVENAGIPNFAWTYVKARIDGTKSEDCFNVLAVDTVSKVLRIMAVGATYDRFMRHTDTIAYNYDTHTLLT